MEFVLMEENPQVRLDIELVENLGHMKEVVLLRWKNLDIVVPHYQWQLGKAKALKQLMEM